MRNLTRFIRKFYRVMFLGQFNEQSRTGGANVDVYDIDIIEVISDTPHNIAPTNPKEKVRNQLILIINWVLVIVCSTSFAVIIFYAVFYPSKTVPGVVQNAFFTTLGWFGGALGTFFQSENS
ncbi:MAG: hypothetical protein F6K16_31595 [Symploca sp. SIO2B6]|nr:hypothetical protein [Symploca sp. SIO2B6]